MGRKCYIYVVEGLGVISAMLRKWFIGLVLPLLLMLVSPVWAASERPTPDEALASPLMDRRVEYIKMFLHQVKWPGLSRQEHFYLEVIGYDPELLSQLRLWLADEQVGGKKINISNTLDWTNRTQLLRPNIAYVVRSSQPIYAAVAEFFKSSPVLMIQEGMAADDNWMVCFTQASDRHDLSGNRDWVYVCNRPAVQAAFAEKRGAARHPSPRAAESASGAAIASASTHASAEAGNMSELERQAVIIADQRVTIDRQRDTIDSLSMRLDVLLTDSVLLAARRAPGVLSHWSGRPIDFHTPIIFTDWAAPLGIEPPVDSVQRVSTVDMPSKREMPLSLQVALLTSFAFLLLLSFVPYAYGSMSTAMHAKAGVQVEEAQSRSAVAGHEARQLEQSGIPEVSMASTISHELLTPLNAIVGLSQLAGTRAGNVEMRVELEQVGRSAGELRRKMEAMVSAMVLAGGVKEVRVSKLDLGEFLAAKCAEYKRLAENDKQLSSVRLTMRVDSCLPEGLELPGEQLSVLLDVLYKSMALRAPAGEVVFGAGLSQNGEGVRIFVFGHGLLLEPIEYQALQAVASSARERSSAVVPHGSLVEILQFASRFTVRLGGQFMLRSPESQTVHVQVVFPLRRGLV